MKKTTIALAALAFSGAALAGGPDPMGPPAPPPQSDMYIGFNVAMTDSFWESQADLNSSWYSDSEGFHGFDQGGFQVGMRFGALRAEVQVNYGNWASGALVVNGLTGWLRGMYDLQLAPGLSVYPVGQIGFVHTFGAGAGSATTNPYYDSKTSFAWGLGAGVTEMINQSVWVYGEYTWVQQATGARNFNRDYIDALRAGVRNHGANVFTVGFNHDF